MLQSNDSHAQQKVLFTFLYSESINHMDDLTPRILCFTGCYPEATSTLAWEIPDAAMTTTSRIDLDIMINNIILFFLFF